MSNTDTTYEVLAARFAGTDQDVTVEPTHWDRNGAIVTVGTTEYVIDTNPDRLGLDMGIYRDEAWSFGEAVSELLTVPDAATALRVITERTEREALRAERGVA